MNLSALNWKKKLEFYPKQERLWICMIQVFNTPDSPTVSVFTNLSEVTGSLLALPSPHLVPVMTRPGSGRSPCPSWVLYTYVPRHFTSMPSVRIVVSMDTALVPLGFLAALWHWIFPHLASLLEKRSCESHELFFFLFQKQNSDCSVMWTLSKLQQIILSARHNLAKPLP